MPKRDKPYELKTPKIQQRHFENVVFTTKPDKIECMICSGKNYIFINEGIKSESEYLYEYCENEIIASLCKRMDKHQAQLLYDLVFMSFKRNIGTIDFIACPCCNYEGINDPELSQQIYKISNFSYAQKFWSNPKMWIKRINIWNDKQ